MNEILLIASMIVIYTFTVLSYRFFGKEGLYCMTVFATLAANIEVMIVVNAFGMEQTLGNILFASTFLTTDILSENEGKKAADKAVMLGIATSVVFIIITQSWLLYVPSESDFIMPSIRDLFSNTPRVMLSSLGVYAVTQFLDVRLYHAWWKLTEKKSGNSRAFLWVRNNFSTLISQLANTVLFNIAAFAGVYSAGTILSIIVCGYIVFIVTSLADTPAVYICRKMKEKGKIPA